MKGLNGLSSWRVFLAGLVLGTMAFAAAAHEMSLAEMSVREVTPGVFVWSWGAPAKSRPLADDLRPRWPEGCVSDSQTVQCGSRGMVGTLAVDGVGKAYSAAIVTIHWREGGQAVYTLTGSQPTVQLHGGARDPRDAFELARTYGLLGVEHILTGIDHLLFVVGLLFLVGFGRQLIGTITAFTVAHSLTLCASALGWLVLRPAPVEVTIALSILLVSAEALRRRETLTRRWPALVAFVFGLVHGLGFAGALKEIGLPESNLLVALLTFNLGVEAGQLLVVAMAWGAAMLLGRYAFATATRRPALYGIGTLAAYWSLLRMTAVLG